MDNFKQKIKNFLYKDSAKYNFSLYEDLNEKTPLDLVDNDFLKNALIGNNLAENRKMMQIKFNSLINSDIVIRDFSIIVNNKYYKAFIVFKGRN